MGHYIRDINGNYIWVDDSGKQKQVTNEGTTQRTQPKKEPQKVKRQKIKVGNQIVYADQLTPKNGQVQIQQAHQPRPDEELQQRVAKYNAEQADMDRRTAETFAGLGGFANMFFPSHWYGAYKENKPLFEENEGLGDPVANLAFDVLVPTVAGKAIQNGANIGKYFANNYKLTMKNAPWCRPGQLNMSVVPLPSRVPSITRKQMPGNILEVLPEFDYRRASLQEQAEYILNNRNAFTTHPFLVRAVEGNPELKKFVKDIADGKVEIPNYTYHSGRQVPLLESTTGENPSLGALITAKETNIDKPHLITLTGMRPVEGTGGEIGKGGLEDFLTRNGYNFSTNSRANATEYSWLGDLSENTQRLNDYGFGTGKLNDYYQRLYKIIEDLNKKYGVKNYAYPNTVNTGKVPIYRGTNKPVNFSLHTHLSKNPNGTTIKWDPIDRAVYEEAMDALSQFWGSEVYGGGVKETLIPRPGLKVLSDQPMDYRALSKHPIVGTDAKTLRLDYLPENIKTMDKFEKWASDNKIKSFQIGIINDPLPSVSYGTRNFYIARKDGGSINNKRATH